MAFFLKNSGNLSANQLQSDANYRDLASGDAAMINGQLTYTEKGMARLDQEQKGMVSHPDASQAMRLPSGFWEGVSGGAAPIDQAPGATHTNESQSSLALLDYFLNGGNRALANVETGNALTVNPAPMNPTTVTSGEPPKDYSIYFLAAAAAYFLLKR